MRYNPDWVELHYGDLRRALEQAGAFFLPGTPDFWGFAFRPEWSNRFSKIRRLEDGWILSPDDRTLFPLHAAIPLCLEMLQDKARGDAWRDLTEGQIHRFGGRYVGKVYAHDQQRSHWQRRGWEEADGEPLIGEIYARFWRGKKLCPPDPYRVWSLSWRLKLTTQENTLLEEELLAALASAWKSICPPGERLWALDLYLGTCRFDPHQLGAPFLDSWGGAAPFNGETEFWVPEDLRFGLAINWPQTRMVLWGAQLLSALGQPPPRLCKVRGRVRGGFRNPWSAGA